MIGGGERQEQWVRLQALSLDRAENKVFSDLTVLTEFILSLGQLQTICS